MVAKPTPTASRPVNRHQTREAVAERARTTKPMAAAVRQPNQKLREKPMTTEVIATIYKPNGAQELLDQGFGRVASMKTVTNKTGKAQRRDRKSTRLNSSHSSISY